ncbi:glycine zipper 2TM domain-containing protein [Qipengyuania sp. MTN3-11]|uniref:glycine zipper 2TM domain-containing protein n=1 Tax=Qipengyuania sp. MTN3-11 TaxID=3056557 RepID=UPI0036F42BB3
MKKTALAIATSAMAFTGLGLSVPAAADPPRWAPAHGYRAKGGDGIAYRRAQGSDIRYWRGQDGQYYCKRGNGTVGLLAGGALGALLGRAVDTRGDRATGTILGAAAGALVGRELTRGPTRCR